ncbi:hypothetical protein LTR70_001105 [Exophiala xenobiotica]|uniref:Uncharacterized protein n=1 Tax=Lithohypha guttulata TaxID=1690604 RepID=A0ABR0KMZ4_9EURO|nr:hypothetical protein LTR24_000705 [Lithohypha guttulata]KAK5328951.1 hypothetical protein LTR70_001105 [Exophiala xenobiotica]
MQAVLPLARSVRNVAITASRSRIPHLEYHILRKLDRPRRSNRQNHASRQQRRHRSSAAGDSLSYPTWSPAGFNSFLEDDSATSPAPSSLNPAQLRRISPRSPNVDFIANQIVQPSSSDTTGYVSLDSSSSSTADGISVSKLLQEANPERLLAWLSLHIAGKAFLAVANANEFDQAFCALDPDILVEPFKQAQRYLRESSRNTDKELHFERSLVNRLRHFASSIDYILVTRQESGMPLTLNACRHALKCAASVGDVRMASHIWDIVMPTNKVDPDLGCYNAYLHAHVWNLAHSEIASVSLRNYKRNLDLRSKLWRPRNLLGYRVSPDGLQQDPDWALRARVLAIFQDISNNGFVTNEETFTNLMIGLARAGDVAGVDSVLKSVWNIDVNALDSFDEEELESPTYYAESHPLKPSAKLLFAIVHAYSVNNSAAKAWTILDYTSRNYALDIPEAVWTELFEYTYVLSKYRSKARRDQGQSAGKIPRTEPENIYSTMIDAPHNVKPNAVMLSMRAKNFRDRRILDKNLDTLRHLEKNMMQHLENLQLMVDTITALSRDPRGITENGMISQKFIEFRRDFQMAFLIAIQQYDTLVLETQRSLREDDWAGSGKQQIWQRERLPKMVEEFQAYMPKSVEYKTRTGHVSLSFARSREQAQEKWSVRSLLFEATLIWRMFDSTDLFHLADQLRLLPQELDAAHSRRSLQHRPLATGKVKVSL